MKLYAENGVYLGYIENINGRIEFFTNRSMTEYMLEEALKIIKKLNKGDKT
jgi:hypothetical protein